MHLISPRILIPALLVLCLVGCGQQAGDERSDFRRFLDDNYARDMQTYPASASRRGLSTNDGAWNPVGESANNAWRREIEQRLAAMTGFNPASLSEKEQLSFALYQQSLERNLATDAFRRHLYPIHQFRGWHTYVPTFLANTHEVASIEDAQNYISRLHGVSELMDGAIEEILLAEQAGMYLPDWSYPKLVSTARNTLVGAPFVEGEASPIWLDFTSKLAALDIAAQQRTLLETEARSAMLESVGPGYQRLIAVLERIGKDAPDQDGVWKFKDGDKFYAERLAYFTTTDLTAEQVHQLGLDHVERIHNEMRAILEQVDFDGGLGEFFEFMRNDPQFYYADDEEGRARYLAEATAFIDTMRDRIPETFGILPKAELEVRRVEAFRERSAGRAFYQYPVPEAGKPGIYYANLYDMKSMPTYQMEALAYHEGIPGHHMQLAITVELEGIPEFQKYTSFTAYTEGWGLYSEMLPKEMGFYQDPYSDFGRLAMELWRAARLVVDTGLHHKRWTREEAIRYLVENTPNSEYDSMKAIERYLVMPGQATAYMIGKLKIVELREKARNALGDKFDIRGFHDELLKDGPVPLSILEAKIDRWIASH